MTKYYIESIYSYRLKNNLTFGDGFDNLLIFDNLEEAEKSIIMYGCVNCSVKSL